MTSEGSGKLCGGARRTGKKRGANKFEIIHNFN